MKRMMLIVLALMLVVSCAQAESIFSIPVINLNFGSITDLAPTSVEENVLTGEITEVYEGVTDKHFNVFGKELGKSDYRVLDYKSTDEGIFYEVGQDSVVMTILYDSTKDRLEVTTLKTSDLPVPEPKKELPSVFKNCQQIEYGEEVKVPGYGIFTIEKLVLGEETDFYYSDLFIGTTKYSFSVDTYLAGHFVNTTPETMGWNHVMRCTLYYITDENTYTYDDWFVSTLLDEGIYIGMRDRSSGVNFAIDNSWPFEGRYIQPTVGSLEGDDFAAVISDVPQAVHDSDDGMLAVKITCGGNDYVVVDRWE